MDLVIQLIAGAIGGALACALYRSVSPGLVWAGLAGALGGGLGGSLVIAILGQDTPDAQTWVAVASGIAAAVLVGAILAIAAGLARRIAEPELRIVPRRRRPTDRAD